MKQALLILELLVSSASAQIIPSSRVTTWKGHVGVPGGIPNRTTIYTTVSAGASAATINSAIAACPSNQVVMLSAGTYTISSSINLKSGVTLRGAGMGSTILNSAIDYTVSIYGTYSWDWDSPVAANHVNWTGNYSQGTSNITVSSTSLAG